MIQMIENIELRSLMESFGIKTKETAMAYIYENDIQGELKRMIEKEYGITDTMISTNLTLANGLTPENINEKLLPLPNESFKSIVKLCKGKPQEDVILMYNEKGIFNEQQTSFINRTCQLEQMKLRIEKLEDKVNNSYAKVDKEYAHSTPCSNNVSAGILKNEEKPIDKQIDLIKINSSLFENWTNKQFGTILYDSDCDKSEKIQSLMNSRNVLFVAFDDWGCCFGGYYNDIINKFEKRIYCNKIFVFTLGKNNSNPLKYDYYDDKGIIVSVKDEYMINFHNAFTLCDEPNESWCDNNLKLSYKYVYSGTINSRKDFSRFHLKRLIIIKMK